MENPPLAEGPLTNEQISWVGSLNCIAAIIGAATFGYFTPLFGSKRSLIVLSLPLMAFWLLIYFGQTYYHVLIARFIGGWTASGMFNKFKRIGLFFFVCLFFFCWPV